MEREVIADGWFGEISFMRSIEIVPACSLIRLLGSSCDSRICDSELLSNAARGWTEKSSSSSSDSCISSSIEVSESLLRFFEFV